MIFATDDFTIYFVISVFKYFQFHYSIAKLERINLEIFLCHWLILRVGDKKSLLKVQFEDIKVSKTYAVKTLMNWPLPGNTSVSCSINSSVVDLCWCLLLRSNKYLLCYSGWKDLDSSCLLVGRTLCAIHGERQAYLKSSSGCLRSNDVWKNFFFQ